MTVDRKVSAAAARAHTRKTKSKSPFQFSSGMLKKILAISIIGLIAYGYQAIQPEPPKICGSENGPRVVGKRVKLSDGRHLAYIESGVPKDEAKYIIVDIHGFNLGKHDSAIGSAPPEIKEELGIHVVSIDRPGYGESDPHPNRTEKSLPQDIEELADQLGLGSKFYITGYSMGAQKVWSCLKYIPHRIAGAILLCPGVNYWWRGFPADLAKKVYEEELPVQDQWALRVSHYLPWLTYWWNTQKYFPYFSLLHKGLYSHIQIDIDIILKYPPRPFGAEILQQGIYESLHRDMMTGFGTWEYDPTEIENPFPNGEGSVHLWQGTLDNYVPATLQRYIAKQLPWIHYHELPGEGHLFPYRPGMSDVILKALFNK